MMSNGLLIYQFFCFGIIFWLGLYMLNRIPGQPRLSVIGAALAAFAVSLNSSILMRFSTGGITKTILSAIDHISAVVTLILLLLSIVFVVSAYLRKQLTAVKGLAGLLLLLYIFAGVYNGLVDADMTNSGLWLGNGLALLL
ncbi:hypothetical protein K0U00_29575, partial [Paenibacillus sepulcri]|nr:hypothetical protein [Paenibacillus sepulcri]